MIYKFGRKARTYNPEIPHMSAMASRITSLPPVPDSVDYTKGITQFGMMMNDKLGDCTCAGVYHARQIWTANTTNERTESDPTVFTLYEDACGYQPGNPSTDKGGVEQDVLTYIMINGIPLDNGSVDKILAFFEVDFRNIDDVKRCIDDCGVAYIGFNVPYCMFENYDPHQGALPFWRVDPNNTNVIMEDGNPAGHCVILCAYDEEGPTCVSWGGKYKMTWDFFTTFTDETYSIVSNDWVTITGKTPLGMTVDELEQQMEAIKG
jgi:hypothetical protein